MDIHVSTHQGRVPVTVIQLVGNLDGSSYEALQTQAQTLTEGGAQDIVIDLKQVPYMSSAGMRALNNIYNSLHKPAPGSDAVTQGITAGTYKSPHLKLVAPSSRVLEALKIAGFDMFLDIKPSLDAAIAAF